MFETSIFSIIEPNVRFIRGIDTTVYLLGFRQPRIVEPAIT